MENTLKKTLKVFSFLFKQEAGKTSYKLLTYGLSFLLFFVCVCGMAFYNLKNGTVNITNIETVYVCNESKLMNLDINVFTAIDDISLKTIKYYESDKSLEETINNHMNETRTVFLNINYIDDKVNIGVYTNENTEILQKDLKKFTDFVKSYFPIAVLNSSDLSPYQAIELGRSISIDFISLESYKIIDVKAEAIKLVMSLLLMFVFLVMCLYYSNSITGLLISDKTNKLKDTLMISVKPLCNIMGKMMTVSLMSVIQLTVWGISLFSGMKVADFLIEHSTSLPSQVTFKSLLESYGFSSDIISINGFIFAVIFMFIGLKLFISVAAFLGVFAERTEDTEIINYICNIICFLFLALSGVSVWNYNINFIKILNIIPFTSPFILPYNLMIDSVESVTVIISFVILIFTNIAFEYFAACIYKSRMINDGKPLFRSGIVK